MYIAGFPEYFDLDASLNGYYVCLRWEKVTGRIDLAINGKFIVGKNTCEYWLNQKIIVCHDGEKFMVSYSIAKFGIKQVRRTQL